MRLHPLINKRHKIPKNLIRRQLCHMTLIASELSSTLKVITTGIARLIISKLLTRSLINQWFNTTSLGYPVRRQSPSRPIRVRSGQSRHQVVGERSLTRGIPHTVTAIQDVTV